MDRVMLLVLIVAGLVACGSADGDPIPPPKDDRTIDMFGTDPLLNEAIDRLIARGSER